MAMQSAIARQNRRGVWWNGSPPMLVPLLPRSSYELTILWHATHSSCIRPSTSAALTSIDGAEEKRIRAPTSSGWVCGRTSLPAHSYRMEDEGEPPVQAVQGHICTHWTRLLGGWTSGFSAALLNASRRLRSRLRRCDTSSLSTPAPPLLPVASDLRRLSRQKKKRQPPRSPEPLTVCDIEGSPDRHDTTPSRSAKVDLDLAPQICSGDWFMSLDLKDAYFHIQVAPPS